MIRGSAVPQCLSLGATVPRTLLAASGKRQRPTVFRTRCTSGTHTLDDTLQTITYGNLFTRPAIHPSVHEPTPRASQACHLHDLGANLPEIQKNSQRTIHSFQAVGHPSSGTHPVKHHIALHARDSLFAAHKLQHPSSTMKRQGHRQRGISSLPHRPAQWHRQVQPGNGAKQAQRGEDRRKAVKRSAAQRNAWKPHAEQGWQISAMRHRVAKRGPNQHRAEQRNAHVHTCEAMHG